MLLLGDLKKDRLEDFIIEPCLEDEVVLGEKFYTELIRPFCVAKGYLPKNKPTPEEVADIEFEEERLKRM